MRKLILLAMFCFLSTVSRAQSVQPMDASDCARLFFKALQDKDGTTLQSIMAADFSITSFDGQPLERNSRTKNYGDVGIVQGTWSARGQIQNISFNNDLVYTLVAVRAGGSWKVTTLQFTPLR
jgi:hypothetical protein